MIALAGCVAQAEGAEAMTRSQMIDLWSGRSLSPPAGHGRRSGRGGRPVDTDMPAISRPAPFLPAARSGRALPTVQEGCDKFCTYCVVPYTRGEISRPWPTSSPRPTAWSTAARGRSPCSARTSTPGPARTTRPRRRPRSADPRLANIDGLERIRYTTSHPADMTDGLIAAHGEVEC